MIDKIILTALVLIASIVVIAMTDKDIGFVHKRVKLVLAAVLTISAISIPVSLLIKIWG